MLGPCRVWPAHVFLGHHLRLKWPGPQPTAARLPKSGNAGCFGGFRPGEPVEDNELPTPSMPRLWDALGSQLLDRSLKKLHGTMAGIPGRLHPKHQPLEARAQLSVK